MGLWTRVVLGRWLARWLLRGSPLAIAAKIVAVGALGAWKYHRELKRSGRDTRQIDAEYEVLGPDRIAPVARPPTEGAGEPGAGPQGNGTPEVDEDPTRSS
ncbi:MAG TPA: hypothetical protein VMR66_01905 [Gemmatimonadota bacterium]|nr:hypothetical protein [Gemmatimonadota bacterium]